MFQKQLWRTSHLARTLVLAGLSLTIACGDDSEPRIEVGDAEAIVHPDGSLSLMVGDRILLQTSASSVPTSRRFEQTVTSAVGSYRFRRSDEADTELSMGSSVRKTADGSFQLPLRGAEGTRGTLSIEAGPTANSTRLTWLVERSEVANSLEIGLVCEPEATFFGFGAQYNSADQRGEAFPLWVEEQGITRTSSSSDPAFIVGSPHTTYFPVPYWLDARGFGILIDTDARTLVDLCQTDPEITELEVEDGQRLSLVVFHGPTPMDVIDQLGATLGRPSAPPLWAFEPWIAVQGGRQAVLDEADALDEAGIPYSALWAQDWSGRRKFGLGNFGVQYRWVSDEEILYPNLREMIAELHAGGTRFLGYANPFVVEAYKDHYPAMEASGLLAKNEEGEVALVTSPNGPAGHPDLTSAESRAYVSSFLEGMALDLGMDGWMADFGEWLPPDAVLSDGRRADHYHNRYPSDWHELSRDALQAANPDGDWVMFSRSGWAYEQGVAQIVWIGDQEVDFSTSDGLPTVIPAMLNLGISGVSMVTHDIGGFSGGPREKEAFLRWTELAAFTPFFRTHEGLRRETNWDWNSDEETIEHFRRFATVHGVIRDELYQLALESTETSTPIVRHLMLAYPEDQVAWGIDDQFLLGPSLLVAPVLEEGATARDVYLPSGTWFHIPSGTALDGPGWHTVEAPIGQPPVFSLDADRSDIRAAIDGN
ncbi:MAG: TIM-barrel domain-containing protein [Myxococcota bacterium]